MGLLRRLWATTTDNIHDLDSTVWKFSGFLPLFSFFPAQTEFARDAYTLPPQNDLSPGTLLYKCLSVSKELFLTVKYPKCLTISRVLTRLPWWHVPLSHRAARRTDTMNAVEMHHGNEGFWLGYRQGSEVISHIRNEISLNSCTKSSVPECELC